MHTIVRLPGVRSASISRAAPSVCNSTETENQGGEPVGDVATNASISASVRPGSIVPIAAAAVGDTSDSTNEPSRTVEGVTLHPGDAVISASGVRETATGPGRPSSVAM